MIADFCVHVIIKHWNKYGVREMEYQRDKKAAAKRKDEDAQDSSVTRATKSHLIVATLITTKVLNCGCSCSYTVLWENTTAAVYCCIIL